MATEHLMGADALARRIGVARSTIEEWGRRGRIPRIQVGRKVIRYSWAAVVAALTPAGAEVACDHCGMRLLASHVGGSDRAPFGTRGRCCCFKCATSLDRERGTGGEA